MDEKSYRRCDFRGESSCATVPFRCQAAQCRTACQSTPPLFPPDQSIDFCLLWPNLFHSLWSWNPPCLSTWHRDRELAILKDLVRPPFEGETNEFAFARPSRKSRRDCEESVSRLQQPRECPSEGDDSLPVFHLR